MAFARQRTSPRTVAIDELTSVPEDLYDTLILAGQRARARGQHHLLAGGKRLRKSGLRAGGELVRKDAQLKELTVSAQKKLDLQREVQAMLELSMARNVVTASEVEALLAPTEHLPKIHPPTIKRPPSVSRSDGRRPNVVRVASEGPSCHREASVPQPRLLRPPSSCAIRAARRSASLTRQPVRAFPVITSVC